jgi:hypothetical protein
MNIFIKIDCMKVSIFYKTVCLTVLVLAYSNLNAQFSEPNKSDKINISISEDGSLKKAIQFALIKGNEYKVRIVVDKPIHQRNNFIKNFKGLLSELYQQIQEDYISYHSLYNMVLGWDSGKFENFNREIKDLIYILSQDNLYKAFDSIKNEFNFFNGREFLNDNLIRSSYSLYTNLNNKVVKFPFSCNNKPSIDFKIKPTEDTIVIEVFLEDVEKKFYQNYHLETLRKVKNNLDTLKVKTFYNSLHFFNSLKADLNDLSEKILKQDETIICDKEIIDRYKYLDNLFNNQSLITSLKNGWANKLVEPWLAISGGKISLNSIKFTDEKRLPFRVGYDTLKAKHYDSLRSSIINLMLATDELSVAKQNITVFDSALVQKGRGREIFDYTVYNENLRKENQEIASEKQLLYSKISKLKFVVHDNSSSNFNLYRTYDAHLSLKGSKADDRQSIDNRIYVTGVGYNIKPKEEFKIFESSVEVPNQSDATSQLENTAGAFSGAFGQANTYAGILSAILSNFRSETYIPKPYISYQKISTSNKKQDLLNFKFDYQKLNRKEVFALINEGPYEKRLKFLSAIQDYLQQHKLLSCKVFLDELFNNDSIINSLSFNTSDLKARKKDSIIITGLLNETYKQLHRNNILQDIQLKVLFSEYVLSPSFNILPGQEFKSNAAKISNYRNEFIAFKKEKKATEKNADIILLNTADKIEIKRKDFYVTAPSTWITPSVGITYVMKPFSRSNVKFENGSFTKANDENSLRILAGIHIHPIKRIIMKDDNFIINNSTFNTSRISIFGGFSFPDPLSNPHLGIGFDLWTGIKIIPGFHFYKFTNYTALNNQILDETSSYVINSPFISLSLDPVVFGKLITNIVKP